MCLTFNHLLTFSDLNYIITSTREYMQTQNTLKFHKKRAFSSFYYPLFTSSISSDLLTASLLANAIEQPFLLNLSIKKQTLVVSKETTSV